MSLLDEFKQKFHIMNKARVSDGEGGYITTWTEGAEIELVVAHNTTIEAQVAEQQGTASTYTFLVDQSVELEYHDVVKSEKNGVIYRITSNTMEDSTPEMSQLNLTKVTAEKWELTT